MHIFTYFVDFVRNGIFRKIGILNAYLEHVTSTTFTFEEKFTKIKIQKYIF